MCLRSIRMPPSYSPSQGRKRWRSSCLLQRARRLSRFEPLGVIPILQLTVHVGPTYTDTTPLLVDSLSSVPQLIN